MDSTGRILRKLDEKRLTENTLVIFFADHGISLGAHGKGINVPDSVEGRSLLGLYQGKGSWDRERIFACFVSPTRHRLNIRCIRTERYKLVHNQLDPKETLHKI